MTRKKILPKAPVWRSLTLQIRRQTENGVWTGQGRSESNVLSKPCGFSCFFTSLVTAAILSIEALIGLMDSTPNSRRMAAHFLAFTTYKYFLAWQKSSTWAEKLCSAYTTIQTSWWSACDTITTAQKEKMLFKKVHIFCKRLNYDPSSVYN